MLLQPALVKTARNRIHHSAFLIIGNTYVRHVLIEKSKRCLFAVNRSFLASSVFVFFLFFVIFFTFLLALIRPATKFTTIIDEKKRRVQTTEDLTTAFNTVRH